MCRYIFNSYTTACLAFPLGAVSGLVVAAIGLGRIDKGTVQVEEEMTNIGVNISALLSVVAMVKIVVLMTNTFVVSYGLREKVRIRCDTLEHCSNPCAWCFKLLFKLAMNLLVACGCVGALVVLVATEALWVILFQADKACGAGQDAVDSVMEVLGGTGSNPLDDVCSTIEGAEQGAFKVFLGSLFLVAGQVIVGVYWMKYSTLGMVIPFDDDDDGKVLPV